MIQYRCLNPRVVAVQEEVQGVEDYISLMSLRFNVPTPLVGRPDDHEPGPGAPGEEPNTPPPDQAGAGAREKVIYKQLLPRL